jgi:AbrB family looped-hinge helix DNA binding protein
MKSTGIIRKIDELGRIVLPIELRRTLGIDIGSPLELYSDETNIMLKLYQGYSCMFCSDAGSELKSFKGKLICISCLKEIRSSAPEPVPEIIDDPEDVAEGSSPKGGKQAEMLARLSVIIAQHPNAKQARLGELLGVSAGRVSQLYKVLKEEKSI